MIYNQLTSPLDSSFKISQMQPFYHLFSATTLIQDPLPQNWPSCSPLPIKLLVYKGNLYFPPLYSHSVNAHCKHASYKAHRTHFPKPKIIIKIQFIEKLISNTLNLMWHHIHFILHFILDFWAFIFFFPFWALWI